MTTDRKTRSRAGRSRLPFVAVVACFAAMPASAQWFGGYNAPPPYGYGGYGYARPLPPDEIVERIEEQGFEDVRRVRLEGSVYVAEAMSEGGIRTRVTVDAYRGRVIDRRPALAGYPGGRTPEEADGLGSRSGGPLARGASPYDEMPESEMRRRGILGGPGPMRDPAPLPGASVETRGELARPADPRLAPRGEGRETPKREPRREATRSPGAVDGTNPDSRPATKPVSRPGGASSTKPEPAVRMFPSTPTPEQQAASPAPVEAANRPAKPVRVIDGVTPMGQSGSPPANQAATPPGSAAKN